MIEVNCPYCNEKTALYLTVEKEQRYIGSYPRVLLIRKWGGMCKNCTIDLTLETAAIVERD